MTRRIGVMGGMFDPVHNGHMQVAMLALQTLQLDQLRMIPCHQPGHRPNAICSSSQRLDMLQLATRQLGKVLVDDREVRRGGFSYTVDTLRSLRDEIPDAVLALILGMDAFVSLPAWHQWQQLFDLAHIVVMARPGYVVDPQSVIGAQLERRRAISVDALFNTRNGSVLVLEELQSPLSSTDLRRRIAAGESVAGLVPPEVEIYLSQHGIYGQQHQHVSQ
ncbi:MAG: hypothetical protein RLZZ385_2191 [Pseudomonadota bacterium]|jgi:nicotinate-nucleotide adenylyltransferase